MRSVGVPLLLCSALALLLQHNNLCSGNDSMKLRKHLFIEGDTDQHTRPVRNQTDRTTVDLLFDLAHIHSMDEWTGTLTVNGFMRLIWEDPNLRWDPEQFGQLDHLIVPRTAVWQPDLTLYNSAQPTEMDHYGNTMMYVVHDGTVHWFPPVTFHTTCPTNHRSFPFDEHVCAIVLGSWTYDVTALLLHLAEEHNATKVELLEHFQENPQWEVTNIESRMKLTPRQECCAEQHSLVEYSLRLRRRSPIYKSILVLLVLLSAALTLALFWLPPNAGEKIVLGGSTLVVQVLLLLYLGWCIPPGGTSIPVIVLCCGNSVTMTSLSLILSVVVINLSRSPDCTPTPTYLRKVFGFRSLVLKMLCIRSTLYEVSGSKLLDDNHVEMGDTNSGGNNHLHGRRPHQCAKQSSSTEWMLLARVIDRIAFIIYCIAFFIILLPLAR